MRIFALRVLLAWWMVPALWVVAWPMAALMFGAREASSMTAEMCRTLWFGENT